MVGIFITARLGSTRLNQKHLIEVGGKTFIEWLAERYLNQFKNEIKTREVRIFIVTSINPDNKKFSKIFKNTNVEVFYGSDNNIPLRHLECAEANGIKYIISVDGDDILCSTNAAREVVEKLKGNVSEMIQTKGLPLGMNVMGYKTAFLRTSLNKNSIGKLETGWSRIFNDDNIEIINLLGYEHGEKLRMTLDYLPDAAFFKTVISNIGSLIIEQSDLKLINIILENGWYKLNEDLNEEYWLNFKKQKESEK